MIQETTATSANLPTTTIGVSSAAKIRGCSDSAAKMLALTVVIVLMRYIENFIQIPF